MAEDKPAVRSGTLMPPEPLRFPKLPSEDEEQGKAGRPEHVATHENRNLVEAMTGFGIIQADIAQLLGISVTTMRKHYREELSTGKIKADALVAQSLFKKAISSKESSASVMAAIFWLRNRAGWDQDPRLPPPGGHEVTHEELLGVLIPGDPVPPAAGK